MTLAEFDAEARALVDEEVSRLRALSFQAAGGLPACDGRHVLIGGRDASLTTFRYASPYGLDGAVLVVVLAALPRFFGMTARHIERGLVFSHTDQPREATQTELENSGG